jgi:cytoskeleton protein RodZ
MSPRNLENMHRLAEGDVWGSRRRAMSNVSHLSANGERKERRRLQLREIAQDQNQEETVQDQAPSEPPPAVHTVGAMLRAARTERGEDAATVAAALKMRADQLEALENEDFARLPGRAYVIGFLRAYAQHVGLDGDALIKRYKDESVGDPAAKPVQLVFPEALEEKRLPNGSIVIIAMVIALVIYGISYLTIPNRKTPAATAKADDVVAAQTEVAAAPVPVTVSTPRAATDPMAPMTTASGITIVPPPTFVAGSAKLPATSPALPAALAPMPVEGGALDLFELPSAALVVAQATAPQAESQAPAAPVSGGARITLKALQATYIRIKDMKEPGAKGVLVDRVLNPGESFQPPDRAGLVMQTGNAGGLQVEVDGRNVGVLGKSGEVITRIPVDPSYFLERVAASQ